MASKAFEPEEYDVALELFHEVLEYSEALAERPIWLVLNKSDLLDEAALAELESAFREAFPGQTVHSISAATGAGLDVLVQALQRSIAEMRERLATDEAFAEAQAELEARINDDVLASALNVRPQRRTTPADADAHLDENVEDVGDVDEDDDGEGPEVVYVRD